jgi:hypothetical protein
MDGKKPAKRFAGFFVREYMRQMQPSVVTYWLLLLPLLAGEGWEGVTLLIFESQEQPQPSPASRGWSSSVARRLFAPLLAHPEEGNPFWERCDAFS